MKSLNMKKQSGWKQEFLFPGIIFLLVIGALLAGGFYFDYVSNMQNIDLLRQSARKAVVQCYTIEGEYPSNIEYLEKNYGLEYNHEKYFIDYDVFASNVMPNIDVFEKE